jgi:hypothetical protein
MAVRLGAWRTLRWVRGRRNSTGPFGKLLGAAAALVLVLAACGPSAAEREAQDHPRTPISFSPPTLPTPVPPDTPATPEPTGTPTPTPTPTRSEPELSCPSKALQGVYSPERLHVLARCQWFVGYVERVVHLADGDVRFDMLPAHGYGRFLNDANRSLQQGEFVAVIIRGQPMVYFLPGFGQRIAVWGTWVRQTAGGWNEMHPVWEVKYGGTTIYAPPPVPPLYHPGGR